MNFVRELIRVCAFLLCMILVFMLPLALLGHNLWDVLFSPEVLLQVVTEEILDTSLLADTVETAVTTTTQQLALEPNSLLNNALRMISQQPTLREQLIPQALVVEIARQLINNIFVWLESPDPLPILQFNLQPIKTALSANATAVVTTTLTQLPPCTAAETAELAGSLLNNLLTDGETNLPTCLPDIIPLQTLVPLGNDLLLQQINALPDSLTLNNLPLDPQQMQSWKTRIQLAELLLRWTLPVTLFLLIIGTLFGGQSLRGFTLWIGVALLASGFLTLLLAVAISGLRQPIAVIITLQLPLLLQPFGPAFFSGVLAWAQRPLLWQGLLQWLIAVVLFIFTWLSRPADKSAKNSVQYTKN